jgi:predicted RNase H-like HicB family nuclease
MPKTTGEYLKSPYARIVIPQEDGTFFAEILEFPGCFTEGTTPDEAFRNLEEAAKAWIESTLDHGQEIPPPSTNEGFSGKLILRLPRSVHRRATRMAERDRTSLNQFLVAAIAERLGAESLYRRMIEGFYRTHVNIWAVTVADTAQPQQRLSTASGWFPLSLEMPKLTASSSALDRKKGRGPKRIGG